MPKEQDGYDWLYAEDPPTKASREPADDLPPPNLPPPGSPRSGGSGRPPRKKGIRRYFRILGLLVAAWIIFLIAVPIWAFSTISTVDAQPEPESARPGKQPGTTFLLVGTDSRKGLTKEEQKELSTGGDGGGRGRTDTIMLLHTGAGPSILLSIPRDSLVPIPGYGTTKINAAYAYGGPKLLVETLEQSTGIRIDNYIEIGFGGLVKVVDSVGGVEICPKQNIKDKDSGLNVKKGCQKADGKTALAYSRARHAYATQDIQRVQSQREVLGGIAQKIKSPATFLNPLRYYKINTGAASALQLGDNVSRIAAAKFAVALSGAMGGKGLSCTVPLANFAVTWDAERSAAMFKAIQRDRTREIGDLCTEDGLPAKKS